MTLLGRRLKMLAECDIDFMAMRPTRLRGVPFVARAPAHAACGLAVSELRLERRHSRGNRPLQEAVHVRPLRFRHIS